MLCVCLTLAAPSAARAQAQPPSSPAPIQPSVRWSVTNTTRVESWRFFHPPPGGGDPDYDFVANRLNIGLTAAWPRVDLAAGVQYVQLGNLPAGAAGPGALGTGALYYAHSGRRDARGLYVRTLFGRLRVADGITVQAGRFPYQSGAESPSGRPKVEAVKRARIDSRLIGEFEWSMYQRTFDGVRGDIDRNNWHLSASWFIPTQGGFEEDAGARLSGVQVSGATASLRPSVAVPATDVTVFAVGYRDDRPVSARPDNTGLAADRADVRLVTFGATAVGSAVAGPGEADWLVWAAGQTGTWFAQRHHAWSLAIESGYQWKGPWQPWVRAGVLHASGDGDPFDDRHGTFFPMLPTVRKYAFTTAYAPMNLRDCFVEVIVRPSSRISARGDVRRLTLVEGADLWYGGSGATQQRGSFFGYAGRASGGRTDLGTVVEGASDVTLGRHVSVNTFVGAIHGGAVVRQLFAGNWLRFVYVELVIRS